MTNEELNLNEKLISKDSPIANVPIVSGYDFESTNERASITQSKLAANAVGTLNLGTAIIGEAQISDGAVSTDKLANDAVTSSKIAGSAVGETDINDSAVVTDKIADNAVTTDKIAGSAVTNTKILSFDWGKGSGGTATFGGTSNVYGQFKVLDEASVQTHSFGSAGFLAAGTKVTIDDNSGTTRITYGTQVAKTIILPVGDEYRALYCVESPEVWFMDFVDDKDSLNEDFEAVTQPPYKFIECTDGSFQVWGKRKDMGHVRFEKMTKEQYEKNNEFYHNANKV